MTLPPIRFVQAKHFSPRKLPRRVDWIVLHSMESPEGPHTAENCAAYFARGERVASAHYCVDNGSIVKCVKTGDVAYGAPNANEHGIHIEFAGKAAQTREQWLDQYGQMMLTLGAELVHALCDAYDIPQVWLEADALKAGRGITTHNAVTIAFKRKGGHTDPGPGFPHDWFMSRVHQV